MCPGDFITAIRDADEDRLVDVVGDEHDRLVELALQPEELALQLGPHDRVDRAERLVHQQDVRVGGEGAGDADALLLTTGQLRRVLLRARRIETDELEQFHARGRCGGACPSRAAGAPS